MFDMQCGKVQDAIHPSLDSGETTFLFHILHFSIYHLSVRTLNLIREPVFQRLCRFVQLHIKAYNDHNQWLVTYTDIASKTKRKMLTSCSKSGLVMLGIYCESQI